MSELRLIRLRLGTLLQQSREKCPGENELTHRFLDWFGNCLGDREVFPSLFNYRLHQTLRDLPVAGSCDGFGNKIPEEFAGFTWALHATLSASVSRCIPALLPPEFVAECTKAQREVEAHAARAVQIERGREQLPTQVLHGGGRVIRVVRDATLTGRWL